MRTRWVLVFVAGQAACGGSEFAETGGAGGQPSASAGTTGAAGKANAGATGAGAAGTPSAGAAGAQTAGAAGAQSAGAAGAQTAGAAGAQTAGAAGAQSAGAAGAQSAGAAGAQTAGAAGAQTAGAAGAQSAGAAGAQSAGAAGAPSAGAAGAPSAGAGGSPAAGAGGAGGATECQCAPGSYCRGDDGSCASCADTSRLGFGPPSRVAAVSASNTDIAGHARFPRPAASGGMLYRTGKWDKEKVLRYSAAPETVAGPLIGGGANATGKSESAPWLLTKNVAGFGMGNLLFDSTKTGFSGDRQLMVTSWTPGTPPGAAIALPTALNTGASNYSIAVAEDTARVFWMSTRNGSAELLTMLPPTSLTQIDPIAIVLDDGCHRAGGDATPWVTPDGKLMLFRSISVNPATGCSIAADQNDLFAVRLDANGQPAASASRLVSSAADETDPALSADLCALYFSREDQDPDGNYEYNVYRAPRE